MGVYSRNLPLGGRDSSSPLCFECVVVLPPSVVVFFFIVLSQVHVTVSLHISIFYEHLCVEIDERNNPSTTSSVGLCQKPLKVDITTEKWTLHIFWSPWHTCWIEGLRVMESLMVKQSQQWRTFFHSSCMGVNICTFVQHCITRYIFEHFCRTIAWGRVFVVCTLYIFEHFCRVVAFCTLCTFLNIFVE